MHLHAQWGERGEERKRRAIQTQDTYRLPYTQNTPYSEREISHTENTTMLFFLLVLQSRGSKEDLLRDVDTKERERSRQISKYFLGGERERLGKTGRRRGKATGDPPPLSTYSTPLPFPPICSERKQTPEIENDTFSNIPLPLASQHEYNFRGEEKKRQEGREFSRSQTFWGKLWDVGANSIGTECSLSLFAWRWKKNSKAEKDFLKDGISDPERKEGDRKSKWKKEKRVRFLSFPSEQKVGGIWALVY